MARVRAGEIAGGLRDLGTRIAGSADTFSPRRGPLASINFVTAHDGFTLADLTAYNEKHNADNGEENRDGTTNNRSWNHGAEGPVDDDALLSARRLTIRNMLATLLFSAGVPLLVAGDEFGRSQGGNNNAYCQDNEISWVDWALEPWQESLLSTTRHLLALRKAFPAIRPGTFFAGDRRPDGMKDLTWYGPDGAEMSWQSWEDPHQRVLQVLVAGVETSPAGSALLIVLSGSAGETDCELPKSPAVTGYSLLWTSASERPPAEPAPSQDPGTTVTVPSATVSLYRVLG
jgi:glycogen debranching enzyme GlgX